MRDAVIDGEFEHLGIDHDQPALVGRQPVQQAQDHGVDGDRLARAGGAGDQQMRHAGEIDDHRLAADGLAEAERQLRLACRCIRRADSISRKIDLLALVVRQFDADGVAARDDGDARRERAHRAGDVVGQPDHARRFDAGRGLEFVERDDRARARVDDLAAHAEVAQHAFQRRRRFPGSIPGSARTCRSTWAAASSFSVGKLDSRRSVCAGFARRAACARAARLRRDLVVLFVLVLVVFVASRWRRRRAARTRSRGDTRGVGARRRACGACSDERRVTSRTMRALKLSKRMHEPAERNRGAFLVVVSPARVARPRSSASTSDGS